MEQAEIDRLLDGFRQCDAAVVIDAMEELALANFAAACARGLRAVNQSLPTMAGIAKTIQSGPRRAGTTGFRRALHWELMRTLGPGQVLVYAGLPTYCAWGGLFVIEAFRRGAAGLVADAPLRDMHQMGNAHIPVYCHPEPMPLSGHYLTDWISIGQPIVCAGVHVRPGDFVIGDGNGVVFVPPEHAEAVLVRAQAHAHKDARREKHMWNAPMDRIVALFDNPELDE